MAKTLLNYIDNNGNKYTFYIIPAPASNTNVGGIKTGFNSNNSQGQYAIQLDSDNKAFVTIPIPYDGPDDTVLIRKGDGQEPVLIPVKNIFNKNFNSIAAPVLIAQNGADGGVVAATELILDGGNASNT